MTKSKKKVVGLCLWRKRVRFMFVGAVLLTAHLLFPSHAVAQDSCPVGGATGVCIDENDCGGALVCINGECDCDPDTMPGASATCNNADGSWNTSSCDGGDGGTPCITGTPCTTDDNCPEGQGCSSSGTCSSGGAGTGCQTDDDCAGDMGCSSGVCDGDGASCADGDTPPDGCTGGSCVTVRASPFFSRILSSDVLGS